MDTDGHGFQNGRSRGHETCFEKAETPHVVSYSIHQHQHRRILRRLDHIFKLPVSRDWRFELGGNGWNGLEEAQQQTALDRVIQLVAVRQDSGNAPLAASAADAENVTSDK